ncbi:hypothetical protein ONZ45_g3325 [Pleurotus djamor]|nr:hypothetical protein ONZ45_g3325 [Pleurotus djamor]
MIGVKFWKRESPKFSSSFHVMSANLPTESLQKALKPGDIGQLDCAMNVEDGGQHVVVLSDGRRIDIEASDGASTRVVRANSIEIASVRQLAHSSVALVISGLGTPFETSAQHIPKYPVLGIQPPSGQSSALSTSDLWATVYSLFTLHHDQEHLPIILLPLLENGAELEAYILNSGLGRKRVYATGKKDVRHEVLFISRLAFWQGAGTGYRGLGWLPPRPSAQPYPYVPSFTRNEQVIAGHPLRPPKPSPGQLLYKRYCPSLGKTLEFHYVSLEADGKQAPPHLEAFHRWQNSDRVNAGWGEKGTLEYHRGYLENLLADPHVLPMIMSWDGEFMGYVELYWVKEDRLAQYMSSGDIGGAATDWDRGAHVLCGEDKFKGRQYSTVWLRSIMHYAFLDDPRTFRVMCEPRFDNGAMIQACFNANTHIEKIFDFPHKRSALVICLRDRFFTLDSL